MKRNDKEQKSMKFHKEQRKLMKPKADYLSKSKRLIKNKQKTLARLINEERN